MSARRSALGSQHSLPAEGPGVRCRVLAAGRRVDAPSATAASAQAERSLTSRTDAADWGKFASLRIGIWSTTIRQTQFPARDDAGFLRQDVCDKNFCDTGTWPRPPSTTKNRPPRP